MKHLVLGLSLFAIGCGTSNSSRELTREAVSGYLGGDFGTVGPFTKQHKQDLDVLAPADRKQALAFLEQGAVGFLIYAPGGTNAQRILIVMRNRVVGDYRVP